MARQWRIEFPGAIYHLLSRGNNHQNIFLSDDDRKMFVDLIGEFSERFNSEVYAYVLMSNHYHILLKTTENNLSKSMQWFGTKYTRRFNINNRASGHLFQGRFKSIIVENDAYLLRLSCYIHRNPLRAGLVKRLSDYMWSSYPFYAYGKKAPDWLNTRLILSQFTGKNLHNSYRQKVWHYSDEQEGIWEDVRHGLIYGSQDFIEKIKRRFLFDKKDAELPQHNSMFEDFEPDAIMRRASEILLFNLEEFIPKYRRLPRKEKEKRDCIIFLLWETGRFSNRRIGTLVGLTYSSVSKLVSQFRVRLSEDCNLRKKYNHLKSNFKI